MNPSPANGDSCEVAPAQPYDPMAAALGPPPTIRDLTRAVLAFALTVACATLLEWDSGAIAWGLWVSSLWIGFVMCIAALLLEELPMRRREGHEHNLGFFAGLFAMFAALFGGFHVLHCLFLNSLLALDPDPGVVPNVFWLFAVATWEYWPIVLMALVSRWSELKRIRACPGNHDALFRPFLTVARLHVMIALLLLLSECGGRVVLYIVLAGAFAPWGPLLRTIIEWFGRREARMLAQAELEFRETEKELEDDAD